VLRVPLRSVLTNSILDSARFYAIVASIAFALALPASALDPNKSIGQFTHTSWSVKDGIPGPVVAIAQTPDGYLWFGTHAGLYRFDGQNFDRWEPEGPGDKLPASSITALLTARDGTLWIAFTSSAVSCLRKGALKNYTPADGLHTGGVLSIAEDLNGSIWAGGASGFSRFLDGRWSVVGADLGYHAPGARQLLVDHRGTLWVATDGLNFGLTKDSIRVNTILKLPASKKQFEATGQPVGYIAQLAEAPDGKIWMAEGSGPRPTVRPVEGRSSPNIERAVQTTPWCLLFDGQTDLWIGLLKGGIRRAPDFRRPDQVSFDRFESKDGLSSDGVHVAFKDREGNIWFGTNRGVDRFRENKATPFTTKEGLSPNPQLALTSTRDGNVWIINYARDRVQHLFGTRMISQTLPSYSSSDSTRVLSVYSDENRVWLGGSFGLAEGRNGKFSYAHVPGISVGNSVEAITSEPSGDLWVVIWDGNNRSLVKRLRKGMWTDFRNRPDLPDSRCRILFGDMLGRVWLGFETGEVVVYDNDRFRRYSASDGLPPGKILTITGDRAGHIWVGGEGGLSQFDGRRFVTLTKENGLPGNSVSAVLEDDDGSLWIAGELGIVRVRPQELQTAFKSISYRMQGLFLDTTDGLPGLPSQEEPFPTATKSADGRLCFATTDGLAVIDPRRLPLNTVPPPMVIQTVTADNRRVTVSPQLHFLPKLRNLEIKFAALSFSIPERVLCRYKLEGYDRDWHSPVGTRLAIYTNLPPRQYRFRVAGGNDDGVWNEAGATLQFDIAPMFYQTNWFRLLCGLVTVLLLWLLYRWRLRFATARLNLQHAERLSERERIARELHDTLLQSIQGLMLRFQAVAKEMPDQAPARLRLEKALDRADEVMPEGRGRLTGLRTFYDECDLSQAFSNVAQEFVGESQTAFRAVVEGTVRCLHPLVRDEAYQIGREALINAFLHAHARNIEVETCYSPKELRIRIQDDGCGIDVAVLASEDKSSHWGLRGMTERGNKIRGHLNISSRVGVGTEVELRVPGAVAYDSARGKQGQRARTPSIGVYER
jgi:signal transduction histidine kinase/ligand-binding sensor domain-containing protein